LSNALCAVGEAWSRHNNVKSPTKCSIGYFQVEDLLGKMGNHRIWGGQVYPRAREGNKPRYAVAGAEIRVGTLQSGNKRERLSLWGQRSIGYCLVI
jgi:hypothetical protein